MSLDFIQWFYSVTSGIQVNWGLSHSEYSEAGHSPLLTVITARFLPYLKGRRDATGQEWNHQSTQEFIQLSWGCNTRIVLKPAL